jgi:WD40 repeat protein
LSDADFRDTDLCGVEFGERAPLVALDEVCGVSWHPTAEGKFVIAGQRSAGVWEADRGLPTSDCVIRKMSTGTICLQLCGPNLLWLYGTSDGVAATSVTLGEDMFKCALTDSVSCGAFCPDGSVAVVCSSDFDFRSSSVLNPEWNMTAIDTSSGRKLTVGKVNSKPTCVVVSKEVVISGHVDGSVRVWRLEKLTALASWKVVRDGAVVSLAWLGDVHGNVFAVVGSSTGGLCLWDVSEGQCVCTSPSGHSAAVTSLAVCDGWIASGSRDGVVRTWNSSLQAVATLHGHEASVTALNFTNVGGSVLLVSGCKDGTLRVWDALGVNSRRLQPVRAGLTPSPSVIAEGLRLTGSRGLEARHLALLTYAGSEDACAALLTGDSNVRFVMVALFCRACCFPLLSVVCFSCSCATSVPAAPEDRGCFVFLVWMSSALLCYCRQEC